MVTAMTRGPALCSITGASDTAMSFALRLGAKQGRTSGAPRGLLRLTRWGIPEFHPYLNRWLENAKRSTRSTETRTRC